MPPPRSWKNKQKNSQKENGNLSLWVSNFPLCISEAGKPGMTSPRRVENTSSGVAKLCYRVCSCVDWVKRTVQERGSRDRLSRTRNKFSSLFFEKEMHLAARRWSRGNISQTPGFVSNQSSSRSCWIIYTQVAMPFDTPTPPPLTTIIITFNRTAAIRPRCIQQRPLSDIFIPRLQDLIRKNNNNNNLTIIASGAIFNVF
jgi:hypothetical protein